MSDLTPKRLAELRGACDQRYAPLSGTAAFLRAWSPDVCLALLTAAEERDRLRADYPGGDRDGQALAWSAVYRRCRDSGMPVFYKGTGRESALSYISELVSQVVSLRDERDRLAAENATLRAEVERCLETILSMLSVCTGINDVEELERYMGEGRPSDTIKKEMDRLNARLAAEGKAFVQHAARIAVDEQRIAALEAERDHWKANHDEMVARNGVLRVRNDLPIDRTDALRRYDNLLRDLKAERDAALVAVEQARQKGMETAAKIAESEGTARAHGGRATAREIAATIRATILAQPESVP